MATKHGFIAIGLAIAACLTGLGVHAQQYAVTRFLDGNAYVKGSGQGSKTQSMKLNMPVLEGDNIWTNPNGRLGILVQDGNYLWVDVSSRLEIDRFPTENARDRRPLRIKVWEGALLLDMRDWNPAMASYLISTPSASVSPTSAGIYLIEVENVDRTRVSSRTGSCIVSSSGSTVSLQSGQMTYADYGYPPLSPVRAESLSSSGLLEFRNRSLPRQAHSAGSVSRQHLPASLSAYASDLDDNGTWVDTNSYGYVWHPTVVAAEWSPYMDGGWGWYPSWGMTWIPGEAWGWAPFHYGRWTFLAGIGWGWIPMPYFAPAWVAWYWNEGSIGWCPLGYYGNPYWYYSGWYSVPVGELYYPYRRGRIRRHHRAPPPHPIYPRPIHGRPGSLHKGGHSGVGALHGRGGRIGRGGSPGTGGLSHNGRPGRRNSAISPINLSPRRVGDYRNGRISLNQLGRNITGNPASRRPERRYPTIRPSIGRTPGRRIEPGRTAFPSNAGRKRGAYMRPSAGRTQRMEPSRSNRRQIPSGYRSYVPLNGNSRSETIRTAPRRYRVNRGYQRRPSSSYNRAPRYTPRRSPLSSRRSYTRPVRPSTHSYTPRYIPSRSSSGMRSPSFHSSGGARSHGGRHRR